MTDQHSSSRAEFLAKVDAGSSSKMPPPMQIDADLFRLVHAEDDLVARFVLEAEAVGSLVHTTHVAGLGAALEQILAGVSACSATVSMTPGEDSKAVREALQTAGCSEIDWRMRPGIDAHYDADIGITDVATALAETGSLILNVDADHSRGAHLAPATHVAILHERQIRADMLDLFADEPGDAIPSSMVIVTGPSKTADIEGVLITGVHGPGAVHVILLREDP